MSVVTAPVAVVADQNAAPAPKSKRRRTTLGRLLTAVFTFAAINSLLGQIDSFRDIGAALARAEWSWVALAVTSCLVTFPVCAVGVRATVGDHLPLGRFTGLQLASKFANLVTPAGLGSTALNVRFMQRHGIDTASALTSDVAISLVSGATELLLVGICVRTVSGRLDIGELSSGTGRVVLIAVLVVGLLVALVGRVPKVRDAVVPHLRRAWATIVRLVKSPRTTLLIAGSALASSVLYALCLGLCLRAYGTELPLATLIVVNWAATTMSSISPVPGGLGVAEAGLVAGLTAAGVPTDVATALTHRLVTFWLPPIAGWLALRRLQRDALI